MISWNTGAVDVKRSGTGWRWAQVSDFSRIAKCMVTYPWSPIVWRNGHRAKKNFLTCKYLVLDFDDGELSLESAINNTFVDCRHVIGTTKSHQKAKGDKPACDRFRVLLEFDEIIDDLKVYEYNMRRYIEIYGADMQCYEGGRMLYPCVEIVSIQDCEDLERFEVRHDIPVNTEYKVKPLTGRLTQYVSMWLGREIPKGQRNTTCYGIARDLIYHKGYSANDCFKTIVNSPTYKGSVDMKVESEIRGVIDSAMRSLQDE